MFKLLQICVEGNRGSTGRIAELIGRHILINGGESYIAYGRYPRPSESKIIKIGNYFDILYHVLLTRLFDRHGFGSKRATRKLVNNIKRIQPDIIHLHHLHGYYINIEILFNYLAKSNIPVIWTFHDCWSMTGHCTNFNYIGCDRWKIECYECPQQKVYPSSLFIDRSNKNFQLKRDLFNSVKQLIIVPVSKWLDNIVANSFLKNQNSKFIYNGVDLDTFNYNVNESSIRGRYGIGQKFFILGVSSPWTERKGLFDFIKLSKLISDDTIILLVGLSRKQIIDLPSNIIGIERTENQNQLRDLYASSNLFINFSVEETFGLTTAEALACGTPALVYNLTACPEVVDSQTGFVIEHGDLNSVIEVIDVVKMNGKSFYQDKCRKRISELFNIKLMISEYLKLYQNTINL